MDMHELALDGLAFRKEHRRIHLWSSVCDSVIEHGLACSQDELSR